MRFTSLFLIIQTVIWSSQAQTNPLNFPLRSQWKSNCGYSGETSIISSMMMYGQYFSQYDLRQLYWSMSDKIGASQGCSNKFQLLATTTLDALQLNYLTFQSPGSTKFLVWIKQRFLAGNAVTIGVYAKGVTTGETYDQHVLVLRVISNNLNGNDFEYIYLTLVQ